jgi:hypothetical protein
MKSRFVFQTLTWVRQVLIFSCGTLSTLLTQIDTGRGIVRFVFSPALYRTDYNRDYRDCGPPQIPI